MGLHFVRISVGSFASVCDVNFPSIGPMFIQDVSVFIGFWGGGYMV